MFVTRVTNVFVNILARFDREIVCVVWLIDISCGSEQLLPAHLRTVEGVTWGEDGAIASGWVNTIKMSSKAQFVVEMAKLQLRLSADSEDTELDENHYVFDPLCPKVVNLHDKARERLAMSDLVTSHRFVFLVCETFWFAVWNPFSLDSCSVGIENCNRLYFRLRITADGKISPEVQTISLVKVVFIFD